MATIDYMITAYGPYSASATGGNGWSRDFLAGVLTIPATPFFTNIGGKQHLQDASTILFCIAFVLVIAVYVIYWKGPVLRKRSPFAEQLKEESNNEAGRRASFVPSASYMSDMRRQSMVRRRSSQAPGLGSRQQSYAQKRLAEMKEEEGSKEV